MIPSAEPGLQAAHVSPDPGRVIAMMTAFEQTAALLAGLRIGLFTAVAEGADTAERLAERCRCPIRSARILADVFTVHGLLTKEDGRYRLAADAAAFLDQRSSTYIGDAARFLASPEKIALYFDDPKGWALRGGPADQANVTPDSPVWVDFAHGMGKFMDPVAIGVAELLRSRLDPPPRRILDIAAGHGLFGVRCLQAFPDAEAVALDSASVLAVAAQTAATAGVDDRWTAQSGSAFDLASPSSYDLALLPNLLHHFDPPGCAELLRRIRGALSKGGVVAIVEYTPDENRVAPPAPALFALSMLTGTPAGDAYTAQELGAMCVEAGLTSTAVESVPQTVQTLILAHHRL